MPFAQLWLLIRYFRLLGQEALARFLTLFHKPRPASSAFPQHHDFRVR